MMYLGIFLIVFTFLYFLAVNYKLSKPKRNSYIANSACRYKDRRYKLRKEFEIVFYDKYEKKHRIFVIRRNVVVIKNGNNYIVPVDDCRKVPKEIRENYATEHQKRLVINFPLNYLSETNECYGKPAEIEVKDV